MLKKVLAALDLSNASEAVFESALELAIATHSQLMLLTYPRCRAQWRPHAARLCPLGLLYVRQ